MALNEIYDFAIVFVKYSLMILMDFESEPLYFGSWKDYESTHMPGLMDSTIRVQGDANDQLGGWRIVFYLSTVLPWTIVQFYDAIGPQHKTLRKILYRLGLSTLLNFFASGVALFYLIFSLFGRSRDFTEAGTMLVALIVNSWFWIRNIKGYVQRYMVQKLRGAYLRFLIISTSTSSNYQLIADWELQDPCWTCITPADVYWITHHWNKAEFNNLIFDNDIHDAPPPIKLTHGWKTHFATSRAFWLTIWSQARRGSLLPRVPMTTEAEAKLAQEFGTDEPHCCDEYYYEYNKKARRDGRKELVFEDAQTRKRNLQVYPDGPDDEHSGQQDVQSIAFKNLYSLANDDFGMCTLLAYIAKSIPHPLTNTWYNSDAWEVVAGQEVPNLDTGDNWIPPPPSKAIWNDIAHHIAKQNVNASGLGALESIRYTGRIVAASNILGYHHKTYLAIVENVLKAGMTARWTYGWSGRLSCYSALWTRDQVYLALLDGITLLAIRLNKHMVPTVIDLLVAFASFTIMEERNGFQVLKMRQEELMYRYRNNKGKTCRGSGVQAIRETCSLLNIPAACSKLDGHPAFLMGWAYEYRMGQPGNQYPGHGEDHDKIEKNYGSSNAIRYPNAII